MRLHRKKTPPAFETTLPLEEQGLLIRDMLTGGTARRSEQKRAKTARGVEYITVSRVGAPEGLTPVRLKVWIFQIERGPGSHLMWELPRIEELLFRGMEKNPKSSWTGNNIPQWITLIAGLGREGVHIQRGTQGEVKHVKDQGGTITGVELAILVHEPLGTRWELRSPSSTLPLP